MSCHELLFLDRTGSPCTAPPSAPMPPSAEAALPAHHWWHASSSVAWSHEIFSRTEGGPYIDMRGWLVFLVDDVCKPRIRSVQDPSPFVRGAASASRTSPPSSAAYARPPQSRTPAPSPPRRTCTPRTPQRPARLAGSLDGAVCAPLISSAPPPVPACAPEP